MRIMSNPSGEVVFTTAGADHGHADGDGSTVPGGAVPAPYQEAIFSGARQALVERGASLGVTFELLEALVHPVDARMSKFREAGFSAMRGWLELDPA